MLAVNYTGRQDTTSANLNSFVFMSLCDRIACVGAVKSLLNLMIKAEGEKDLAGNAYKEFKKKNSFCHASNFSTFMNVLKKINNACRNESIVSIDHSVLSSEVGDPKIKMSLLQTVTAVGKTMSAHLQVSAHLKPREKSQRASKEKFVFIRCVFVQMDL